MRPLYPDQELALNALRQSLGRGFKRVMVQAPTGFGKTVFASHIVQGVLDKGNRPIFCVPSISLVDQTVMSLYADGITDVGVIQADHPMTNYSMPVQVASIQSLMSRSYDSIWPAHEKRQPLVIIDEAHEWFQSVGEWMSKWSAVPFIGLSATPWTKGLGKHYQDLVIAATTGELIHKGRLSPFRVLAPAHPDLSGVKTVRGDFHEGQLAAAMMRGSLVADIVSTWKKRGEDRPTLCFAVNCAHAQHIQQEFLDAGISAGYVDAYVSREDRQVIAKKFHAGEYKVVVNVGTLTKGVDWDVRCIILARPTKSEMLYTQIVGRGLRLADGKEDCLILDHSDTTQRLGFVTDIHHDKLHDGTKEASTKSEEKSEPLPTCCDNCHAMKPAKTFVCPSCGHTPVKRHDVETVAGELEEMATGGKGKAKLNRNTPIEDKAAFYGGLMFHAQSKGFKPGWAANQYREKFGVWPNHVKQIASIEPHPEAANWVKHQNIKYARRKHVA